MDKIELRRLLNKPYTFENWKKVVQFSLPNVQFYEEPIDLSSDSKLTIDEKTLIKSLKLLGYSKLNDGKNLALFEIILNYHSEIYHPHKALRNVIGKFIDQSSNHGVIAIHDAGKENYRFSFAAKESSFDIYGELVEKETDTRKFTYILGEDESCHTPAQQLYWLHENIEKTTLNSIIEAFRVDKLGKKFFEEYTELFKDFVQFITGKRIEKVGGSWKDVKKRDPSSIHSDVFDGDDKAVRDYVKLLLGRLVVIQFLQKKRWMGADLDDDNWESGQKKFLSLNFNKEKFKNSFHTSFVLPLFEALNTPNRNRYEFILTHSKVPYLGGGLFTDTNSKLYKLEFDSNLFERLFDFFGRYNFTVDEYNLNDHEYGINPEMLGHIFENLLEDNKEKGAFYTPKAIVEYMCQESLVEYLITYFDGKEQLPSELDLIENLKNDLRQFIGFKISKNVLQYHELIAKALLQIRICDPAIGSGAFPMGILKEIFQCIEFLHELNHDMIEQVWELDGWQPERVKAKIIQNSIYGIDIEKGAVEIARLRFWLSLIVDENTPSPLPNLDYKIIVGDSLDGFNYISERNFDLLQVILPLKKDFFDPQFNGDRNEISVKIEALYKQIYKAESTTTTSQGVEFDFKIHFSEIMDDKIGNGGFDIVIANPPYVNTKQIKGKLRSMLENQFKWVDDLYNHFAHKAFDFARDNGVITFISSDTFLTLQTKANMRRSLLKNELRKVVPTPKAFAAMVDTAIFIVKKNDNDEDYSLDYIDIRQPDFSKLGIPQVLLESSDMASWEAILQPLFNSLKLNGNNTQVPVSLYRENLSMAIFSPTSINLQIRYKLIPYVKELFDKWWDKIKTSREITKNNASINEYKNHLNIGNYTLLGLITDGGQGLATGSNGKFVGCYKGSKEADRIIETRPKKLFDVFKANPDLFIDYQEFAACKNKNDFANVLFKKDEIQIRNLFDTIKEEYGRDVFGQGYLFQVIDQKELADIDKMTNDEKKNGFKNSRIDCYVKYDKGDKDGNKWHLNTPYYINWSKDYVDDLKERSHMNGAGKSLYQNSQFYFREGFCWTDINSVYLKSRIKEKSIHDVVSMTLFPVVEKCPAFFIVSLINSKFMSEFVEDFLNNTSHFQINDARRVPIKIADSEQLKEFQDLFDRAFLIKKNQFSGSIEKPDADAQLERLQFKLDKMVYEYYGIDPTKDYSVEDGLNEIIEEQNIGSYQDNIY